MKKITSVILVLLLAANAVGCSILDKKADETSADTIISDVVITTDVEESSDALSETKPSGSETDTETDSGTDAPAAAVVTVKTESFSDGNNFVTLMYPAYGDGKHDAFDAAMRSYAVQKMNVQGLMPEDSATYEILTCDVKLETEYFVSAVITGQIINPTFAHDMHFAYTVNADTASGKVYLSEELVGDVELIKSGLSENRFTQSYGIDGLMDAIADEVVTYESITQGWRSDYGIFPDMYFTEGTFGVVAELPHAVGGYAGFEVPYTDAGDMINPVAKGLVGIIVTTD